LGRHVDLPSHKKFQDRVDASSILINKYGFNKIPIFYDTMADSFDQKFSVWPERYYLIKDGKMDHVFNPTVEFGFDRDSIKKELEKRLDMIQNVDVFVKTLVQQITI